MDWSAITRVLKESKLRFLCLQVWQMADNIYNEEDEEAVRDEDLEGGGGGAAK